MEAAPGIASASGSLASGPLSFSVVIPTYNEAADIADTVRCVLAQTLPAREVIVVDGGSTDGTLARLRPWRGDRRLRVVSEGLRRGVAAARNTGARAARGDIVVFLNADVLLPRDFLARLAGVYAAGADAVSVDGRVENLDCATGRYLQALHERDYPPARVGWSEGFSCRREAALAALFPEEILGAGGEDVEFLRRLVAAGYRWRVDYGIVVRHRVPAAVPGFIAQFRGRGRAVPHIEHGIRGLPLALVVARRAAALAVSAVRALLIVPNAIEAFALARRSPRGLRDVSAFWALRHIQFAAHRLGEWETLIRICGAGARPRPRRRTDRSPHASASANARASAAPSSSHETARLHSAAARVRRYVRVKRQAAQPPDAPDAAIAERPRSKAA
ncbi:MAG TPA: glycosyltransferase family A protein [Polyangia bacterium]|nr:glycosyltransferase family A protein [Polyangia bacterium]